MDDTNNAKGNGSFGEKLLSENEDLVTQNVIEDKIRYIQQRNKP